MEFEPERVLANVRKADTEDLLDRITVYRAGMEPEAIEMIEQELSNRGIDAEEIRDHAEWRSQKSLLLPDGTAMMCSFCYRPAVTQAWGWHWLSIMAWGKRTQILPIFPRYFAYCEVHSRPPEPDED